MRVLLRMINTQHVLIDDVLTNRLAIERAQDIARGLLAHPIHCFPSHSRDMRRHDDIGKLKQRMTGRRWLLLENVEARTGILPATSASCSVGSSTIPPRAGLIK